MTVTRADLPQPPPAVVDDAVATLTRLYGTAPSSLAPGALSTGFRELDRLTGGLRAGGLYLVAGRPGMGKTTLAIDIAMAVCGLPAGREPAGAAVLFLCLGASASGTAQIVIQRQAGEVLVCARAEEPRERFARWLEAAEALAKSQLWFDDRPVFCVRSARKRIMDFAHHLRGQGRSLGLVVFDPIDHLLAASGSDIQAHLGVVTELRRLAIESGAPVISTVGVSRRVEHEKNPRPDLRHVAMCQLAAQRMDVVMGLYRDYYYFRDSAEPGVCDVSVFWNRFGADSSFSLEFVADGPTFRDLPAPDFW